MSRGQGDQTGADPQQAGLTGPVRAFHQDGLPHGHFEVDPGEKGEPTGERDRVTEGDCGGGESCGGHGLAVNATGVRSQ